MSKLSVYAGLEIVVEVGAMIPFQLEPRSAVHVLGQDETNLLHSKGIFLPRQTCPEEEVPCSYKTLALRVDDALAR